MECSHFLTSSKKIKFETLQRKNFKKSQMNTMNYLDAHRNTCTNTVGEDK